MKKTVLAALLLVASIAPGLGAGYSDLNVAISYFNRDQFFTAITWFDKALAAGDLIPDQKRIAYLDRGMAYRAKGDNQKALADFSAAIVARPDDMYAYRERISTSLALGDPRKALFDYETLLKIRPRDYDILISVGWLYWQFDRLDEARQAFRYFSNVRTEAWLWLQLVNLKQGKPMDRFAETVSARDWPGPVALFFQGSISETAMLDAAKKADDLCSGNLYAGMWRSLHNDRGGASQFFKASLETCGEVMTSLIQAEMAKLEKAQ